MSPSILALVAAVFVGGLIAWRVSAKKTTPRAGGGGPVRYSRNSGQEAKSEAAPKKISPPERSGLKTLTLWAIGILLLSWLALSFIQEPEAAETNLAAPSSLAQGPSQSQDPYAPVLTGKLSSPPSPEELASLAPGLESPLSDNPSPQNPIAPSSSAQTSPIAPLPPAQMAPPPPKTEAPSFQPLENEDLAEGAMSKAGQGMAPVISRMEPLGRALEASNASADNAPKDDGAMLPPRLRPTPAPKLRLPVPVTIPTAQTPPRNQPANTVPPPPLPAQSRRYTVLLGSFTKPENAEQLKDKMVAAGLPVTVSEVTVNNKIWWRVMSGSFDDQGAAEAYGRELRQKSLVETPLIKAM